MAFSDFQKKKAKRSKEWYKIFKSGKHENIGLVSLKRELFLHFWTSGLVVEAFVTPKRNFLLRTSYIVIQL